MKALGSQEKPTHIAIIMDGNGRWGEKIAGKRSYGHINAKQAVKEALFGCLEEGIPYLTLYAFSTENWGRAKEEVNTIFDAITSNITENLKHLQENNIKFSVIGNSTGIPTFCWNRLKEATVVTRNNTKLQLTVAINYGGRAETVAASEAMVNDYLLKAVNEFLRKGFDKDSCFNNFIQFINDYQANITPDIYKKYLYTSELPNVDLLIRTGGKKRISNFLPWQCAYTEFYFTDVLWPAFTKAHLIEALTFFQKQNRTFGQVV